jgi:DNA polymerase
MIASIAHTGADLADTQPPREWRFFYHANIFNPTRVKVHAMQAQVPKEYWRNLPEATLIPTLLRDAPQRVKTMTKKSTGKELLPAATNGDPPRCRILPA